MTLKRSILVPVIKANGLDIAEPNNFRPIANVSFMSKIIEKIVATQLMYYLWKKTFSQFFNQAFTRAIPQKLYLSAFYLI